MANVVAVPREYLAGDAHLSVTFHITIIERALRAEVGDRNPEVEVQIPHYIRAEDYYQFAVNHIIDSFDDLQPAVYVLPSDVAIIGWRELLPWSERATEINEDFLGLATTSGSVGQFGWNYLTTGTAVTNKVAVSGHPGVMQLQVFGGNAWAWCWFPSNYALSHIQELVMIARVRRNSPVDLTDLQFTMGLEAASSFDQILCNIPLTSGATRELELFVRSGENVEIRPSGVTVAGNDWIEYRLSRVNVDTFRVRLSNLTQRTVDTMRAEIVYPGQALMMRPSYSATTLSNAIALEMDFCRLGVSGLTRA